MEHLIDEIWIITQDGLTLYNQKTEESMNEHMFGGFIAAINQFVKAMGADGCEKIVMGNSKIFILSCEEKSLFFISRSGLKVKDKKIEKYVNKIMHRFLDNFNEQIKQFDGNIDSFGDVDEIINIIDDPDNFFGIKINRAASKKILDSL
ncbi:MAG: hypothetical protein ACTSRG_16430 [Candidatus Helarchaeota archaeon]